MKTSPWNVERLASLQKQVLNTNLFENADIIVVTETVVTEDSYMLPNMFSCNQPKAVVGIGIAIIVKPDPNPVLISKLIDHVVFHTELTDIVEFYFPPSLAVDDVTLEVASASSSLTNTRSWQINPGDTNCRLNDGDRGSTLCDVMWDQWNRDIWNDSISATFHSQQGKSVITSVLQPETNRGPCSTIK